MIARMGHVRSGVRLTRRVALRGAFAGAGACLVSACEIRREGSSAPTSSPPSSAPPPDQPALRREWHRLRELADAASQVRMPSPTATGTPTGSSAADGQPATASPSTPTGSGTRTSPSSPADQDFLHTLASLHRTQASRLKAALVTPPDTSRSSDAPTSVTDLAIAERHGVGTSAIRAAAGATPTSLPTLACLAAFHGAVADRLGHAPTWPDSDQMGHAVARDLLTSVRPCVYALEVIAARTPLKRRARVTASLQVMYAARTRLVQAAGSTVPPPPPDYRLPVQVTDSASATRLARTMLHRVVRDAASQAPRTAGDPAALGALVRLWSEALGPTWQWGASPDPFPGLRT